MVWKMQKLRRQPVEDHQPTALPPTQRTQDEQFVTRSPNLTGCHFVSEFFFHFRSLLRDTRLVFLTLLAAWRNFRRMKGEKRVHNCA